MKKKLLTLTILLGLALGATAQQGGGLFGRGHDSNETSSNRESGSLILLPNAHSTGSDINGETGEPAPLGSGIAVLAAMGAAYAIGKKRNKE